MHRLKRAQRVFAPSATKSKSYPLKTPQNRADEFYGYELLCTRLAGGRFHPEFTPDNSKPAPNRLKTVNGDAIYCVAVKRCRRSRKPVFSTFRNRVRRRPAITLWQVAGRLTTRFTGDSTRDLTLESPWSKSHQPGKSTLESSHHNVLIIWRDSHMNRGQVIGDSP